MRRKFVGRWEYYGSPLGVACPYSDEVCEGPDGDDDLKCPECKIDHAAHVAEKAEGER